ncbi:MAG: histidinol-phosphate transaminase [Candidatus Omnitrophica bacterium]|nr:histidinol-phosphate transaminase [Candidatus Omnitrophota bacterium]
MSLVRKHILRITPYKAGKPIEETKRELGLKKVIKLASNENPFGPSLKAIKAIEKNLTQINRYPDSHSFYLKKRLAGYYHLQPANIILGNGSDELIDIIIKTFVEDDENIITAKITFLEYEIIAQINKKKIITVPLRDFKYDLKAIKKRINQKTKLIFISNPNNPTGTYVNKYEIEDFMQDLPDKVIVVFDEAYDTFIDADDFLSGMSYVPKRNVIVLKTFSKAYGLAGLRLGYALTKEIFASYMERVRQPFNVNILAQIAGESALEDDGFLAKTRREILEGKRYLYKELNKLGINYIPSVANFILIDIKRDGVEFFKKMLSYGVIIRDMQQYGLKNFIRVTIGTSKENKIFIDVLKKILHKRKELR